MSKKLGYKPAKNKASDAGGFGNMGQKAGKHVASGKEKTASMPINEYMKKVVKDMRKQKKSKNIGLLGNPQGGYAI